MINFNVYQIMKDLLICLIKHFKVFFKHFFTNVIRNVTDLIHLENLNMRLAFINRYHIFLSHLFLHR